MLDSLIKWLKIGEVLYREKVVALFWIAAPSLKTMQPSKACFWPSKSWWLEQTCWPEWLYCPFSDLELVSRKEKKTCLAGAGYVVTIYSGSQMMRLVCPAAVKNQWNIWFLMDAWAPSLSTTWAPWLLWATEKVSARKLCWFSKGNRAPGMEHTGIGPVLSSCFWS